MTQIEALENAWSALKTHSESGNDDAGEAMPVIEKMLTTLMQRYDRRKIRRDGIRSADCGFTTRAGTGGIGSTS